MARRRKSPRVKDSRAVAQRRGYGLKESREKLERRGLHPEVTKRSPKEFAEDQRRMISQLFPPKVSRADYPYGLGAAFQGRAVSVSRQLSRKADRLLKAPLIPREDFMAEDFMTQPFFEEGPNSENMLVRLLQHPDLGRLVIEHIAAHGLRSVESMALTSSQTWRATFRATEIFSCVGPGYLSRAKSGLFMAVSPEYTLGDFASCDGTSLSRWATDLRKLDEHIFESIHASHSALHKKTRGFVRNRKSEKSAQTRLRARRPFVPFNDQIRQIRTIRGVRKHCQFAIIDKAFLYLYEMPYNAAMLGLQGLLLQIHSQCRALKVLYLHKIPFLDRRILAIILRACQNVTTLGIYDCPLIHFGDVIPILDLIHEVNRDRHRAGLAEVDGFDFAPYFEKGMPYHHRDDHGQNRAFAYGLSWHPLPRELTQRGFYAIILMALLKTKQMRLRLLFEKGQAFRNFLFKVPNPPLAVATFLDGVYRFLDLVGTGQEHKQREALYDMMKPVRLGVEVQMEKDSEMKSPVCSYLVTCAYCKNDLHYGFAIFRAGMLESSICAACNLRDALDRQRDHLRPAKRRMLTGLLSGKGHDPTDRNPVAPFHPKGAALLRQTLSSHASAGGKPPASNESLHRLPSLGELCSDAWTSKWNRFKQQCHELDVYRVATQIIHQTGDAVATREDGGAPDSFDELQGPSRFNHGPWTHESAMAFQEPDLAPFEW